MSASIRQSVLYAQNFLKDPHLVASLLDRSHMEHKDVVYEIGPGKGVITEQLARRYQQVVAIEKDPRLADLLREQFSGWPHVTVYAGDFLSYPLPNQRYKVFANIPFNITSAIVTRLTTAAHPPEDAHLIMQKEAAEMFLGEPRFSLRSLLLKPWFSLEITHRFQRRDFTPAPRVDVVMLRLRKRGPPLVEAGNCQLFRDFVVHLFTNWQPSSPHALNSVFTRPQRTYIQRMLGLDLDSPPASLPIEQWLRLFGYFQTIATDQARQKIVGSEQRLIQQQKNLQKIHRTRVT